MGATLETLVPSKVRRVLIVELFGKGRHSSASDLARDLELPYGATHRELQALLAAGLVTCKKRQRAKIFGPELDHEAALPLRRLAVMHLREQGWRSPLDGKEIGPDLRRKAGVLKFARKLRVGVEYQKQRHL